MLGEHRSAASRCPSLLPSPRPLLGPSACPPRVSSPPSLGFPRRLLSVGFFLLSSRTPAPPHASSSLPPPRPLRPFPGQPPPIFLPQLSAWCRPHPVLSVCLSCFPPLPLPPGPPGRAPPRAGDTQPSALGVPFHDCQVTSRVHCPRPGRARSLGRRHSPPLLLWLRLCRSFGPLRHRLLPRTVGSALSVFRLSLLRLPRSQKRPQSGSRAQRKERRLCGWG